ncbi:MAG: hydantoinase B/oxoprolinase family protein [Woeseia sp.]
MHKDWQFWIDRGGTFTDIIARRPDGELQTAKLLSENPAHYADAAAEGLRRILEQWREAGQPDAPVAAIKMGTTVATNALLERRGSKSGLLLTKGFEDALLIGYQNRPDIFALNIVKPAPLYAAVAGVSERMAADGTVIAPLDEAGLTEILQAWYAQGLRAIAVCLLHAYRYSQHEQRIAAIARGMGFTQISLSHDVEPLVRFVSRAQTTLADAYLTPVLQRYIDGLRAALRGVAEPARLLFMQSSGGLADAAHFRGKDSVLSGPAGGVVGMVEAARDAGLQKLVGFDMGGTSTDVSAYSGSYERSNDSEIAGIRLRAPMMKIHTIAAGGGSLLRYKDERFQVGPDSAGADPGPCCYRQGGPLTITDANVFLGRVPADFFPAVFGANGDQAIDTASVQTQFAGLARRVSAERGQPFSAEQLAAGFLTVAVESMANAIRKITIERGEDVRDFALCSFGGAGGQHACRIADVLGMRTIWLHPLAGVLSAYGMGLASLRVERQRTIEKTLDAATADELITIADALQAECAQQLAAQQVPADQQLAKRSVSLRVAGSEATLDVALAAQTDMQTAFDQLYSRRFGAARPAGSLIVATLKIAVVGRESEARPVRGADGPAASPARSTRMWSGDSWCEVPVYRREALTTATRIDGPAIVAEDHGTTVIEAGWSATLNEYAHLLLQKSATDTVARPSAAPASDERRADPIRLEVMNRLFMNIAEQMGGVLQNTALSVNIRERLDFSCALFDGAGRLVSNAPHMPVHLGSMGESVRSVIAARGASLQDGDAVMLNSPYNGGTHLPDITVVSPWFAGATSARFYVASRAHHADIGGITPGSMPANSRHIDEEGVLLDNVMLVQAGQFCEDEVRERFAGARWPARNIEQNIADLAAQLAANRQGIRQLAKAVDRYGIDVIERYLGFVRENARVSVERLLDRLADGEFTCELDSGDRICVAIKIDRDRHTVLIDFSGTSPQLANNFNAPEAVTRAAVLYVFRSMIREDIPLNEGCLAPLQIHIPAGCMLSPAYPAAVVAGNVETSQCVTDALLGALRALAHSQGTMNNLSFGNARYQYYETIAGGAGAGPGWDGADAVQTHMTNSRLTDPEILETTYPVRIEQFAVRRGSGGAGRYRGGDGIVRQLRFQEAMQVTVLSNRRRVAPAGLDGGADASVGINTVIRADGRRESLPATITLDVNAGDVLCIETPGGGGYGAA